MSLGKCCTLTLAASALLIVFGGLGIAARPLPGPQAERHEPVAVDALRCWWRSDKTSVRIGEAFSVILTCERVETSRERTVFDDSALDPNALSLSPFQVRSGVLHEKIHRVVPGPDGPVTFHTRQYAYKVRLTGEGFFGKDVALPSLQLRYHIDRMTETGVVTPGKERTYLLPPLPMRIQSLVPMEAKTIRDAESGTFAEVEGRRKKAFIAFAAAGIFLVLPVFFLLPGLVKAVRHRQESNGRRRICSAGDLLKGLLRELGRIEKRIRPASWDEDALGKVLTVFRVGGALALSRPISQTPVEDQIAAREGQLEFRAGLWPRTRILISASLTPEAMAADLTEARWQAPGSARCKALLMEAQGAFAAVNQARYAASGTTVDHAVLNVAVQTWVRLLRELRRDHAGLVLLMGKAWNLRP